MGTAAEEPGPAYMQARLEVAPVGASGFRLPPEVRILPLAEWAPTARAYATQRHLGQLQIGAWGIGYAVLGRLAGRLVIPVRDRHGTARSYMARTFAGHAARYFYPFEREHPDMDVMFGELFWPDRGRRDEYVVAAEGALNALAVERCNGPRTPGFVAALGGSDPRPIHVAKLATFGHCIVLTDEDPAGRGAAAQLMAQLQRHTRVTRVTLGEGRDADDLDPRELKAILWSAVGETVR
jgi:DNA primase